MLSILIPVYNTPCYDLARSLDAQADRLGEAVEMILMDDASTDIAALEANLRIKEIARCRYIPLSKNVGRARIRNLLIDEAKGDLLLFMDSDTAVLRDDFLARYLNDGKRADIVCGGLVNPDRPAQKGCELRYRYERAATERRKATQRSLRPWDNFVVFNTLFRRQAFETVRFDEHCTEYGYEDDLLGVELEQLGLTILHSDNPLIHLGEDTNDAFILKTEAALRTLYGLSEKMKTRAAVSRLYLRIKKAGLHRPLVSFFYIIRPLLKKNLLGARPNLKIFAFYKLGYYASLNQR